VNIAKQEGVDLIVKPREVTRMKVAGRLINKKNDVDQQPQESLVGNDVSPETQTRINDLITSPKSMNGYSTLLITGFPRQKLSSPTPHGLNQHLNLSERTPAIQARKKLIVIAGLGLQQEIPIAGQAVVPYSYYGTNNSLPDYLPHLFVQLQKENKWFVEGDFRFGVAQAVNEFPYSQKTIYDTATMNLTVTTMRLKKTYYHELSSSFNYFLFPNLSLGAGGMYSRFHGAITEQETNVSNVLTLANKSVKQIIPVKHFTDSFLYKNQLRVLMQVGYQWKKLSFSLRYTKDIQPYIKYTRPNGTVTEEKNQSLQFLLRYKLWQSRRF